MNITTHSTEETYKLAKKIASSLKGGEVICLYGDLGAGKTTFTKGLAQELGIMHEITSPTFTLMNTYSIPSTNHKLSPTTFTHIDTYRLKDEKELFEIGVEDYLGEPGVVTVVEWPEKIDGLLAGKKVTKLHFKHLKENEREITIDEV